MIGKTLEKVKARPWVMHVDDERNINNGIIVMLKTPYCFEDDPGCGTRGFDTAREAEIGTRATAVYEEESDSAEAAA